MRDIWRAVKELVDTMSTVGLDHAAIHGLRVFFYRVAWISEEHTRLDELD